MVAGEQKGDGVLGKAPARGGILGTLRRRYDAFASDSTECREGDPDS